MGWFKRQTPDERLAKRIRELETELAKRDAKIDVLEDQVSLLAKVNAFNHRHLDEVTGRLADYSQPETHLNVAG